MRIRNTFILIASALFFATSSFAQTPKAATVRYDKTDRPGLVITYPFSDKIVEAALRNHLDKDGFTKRSSRKGFDIYKAQNWDEISGKLVDVYTNVDGRKGTSTVSLLVSKGYDNFVTAANDSAMFGKMKIFLSSLLTDILQVQLRADIDGQNELIKNTERDLSREQDNNKKLLKQKEDIEKDIANSNNKQANITKAIAEQKAKLLDMQSKLK
ncbi:MAG: hypothetical protein ABI378_05935 [Chitinophagaceae bacterium]